VLVVDVLTLQLSRRFVSRRESCCAANKPLVRLGHSHSGPCVPGRWSHGPVGGVERPELVGCAKLFHYSHNAMVQRKGESPANYRIPGTGSACLELCVIVRQE